MSFWSNPIGNITSYLGMQNQFTPQGAGLTNPFGTNENAQDLISGAQDTSADIRGQQGALGQQLISRMNASDPRYDALIQQTMAQAAGQGPNPAQAQFQQNMNQAVQQQAGTIASVRGINPAMAAKLAATGGANMMQGAAGQAAVTQAQQQLAAQGLSGQLLGQQGALQAQYGALGANLLGTMGQQGMTQQQIYQAGLANWNAQNLAQQQGLNQIGAGIAGQNAQTAYGFFNPAAAGQGIGAIGSMFGGGGGGAAAAKGGRVTSRGVTRQPKKMADGGAVDPTPLPSMPFYDPPSLDAYSQPPASLAEQPPAGPARPATGPQSQLGQMLAQARQQTEHDIEDQRRAFYQFAGAPTAPPPVLSPANFARGGQAGDRAPRATAAPEPGPSAADETANRAMGVAHTVAQSLAQMDPRAAAVVFADLTGIPTTYTPEDVRRSYHALALHNAALLSQRRVGPGEPADFVPAVPPKPTADDVIADAMSRAPRARGAAPPPTDTVPLRRAMGGRATLDARSGGPVPGRARVAGDSEKNDTVPAMLSPNEIVLPRSVTMAPDAPRRAADFVSHLVARRKFSFGGVVSKRR